MLYATEWMPRRRASIFAFRRETVLVSSFCTYFLDITFFSYFFFLNLQNNYDYIKELKK